MSGSIISCHIHDYVEIACMYGYQIRLTLYTGDKVTGRAKTTSSKDKLEYLVIETTDGEMDIEMNQIKTMRSLIDNPHFTQIDF